MHALEFFFLVRTNTPPTPRTPHTHSFLVSDSNWLTVIDNDFGTEYRVSPAPPFEKPLRHKNKCVSKRLVQRYSRYTHVVSTAAAGIVSRNT